MHDFSETVGDIGLLNKFRPEEPDGRLDTDQASSHRRRTGPGPCRQRPPARGETHYLPLAGASASACSICTCRRWAMCGISGRVFSSSASVCSIYACRSRAMCRISRGVFSSSGPARGQRSLITNLVLPALSSLDITFAGLTVSDAKFALATSFGGQHIQSSHGTMVQTG